LGYRPTPNSGECGEDPPQFPSLRVTTKTTEGAATLRFARVHLPKKQLRFTYFTHGKFEAEVFVDDKSVWHGPVDGRGEVSVPVPGDAGRAPTVLVKLHPTIPNARVDLFGTAQ
jgi:hypothetical protein